MNQTQTLKNLSGLSFSDLSKVLSHMGIKISGSALGMRANRNNKEFTSDDMQKIIDACDEPTPETQGFVDSLNDAAAMIRYLMPAVDVTDIAEEETFENAEPMDLNVPEPNEEYDIDLADDEDVKDLIDDIDNELDEPDDLDFEDEDDDLDLEEPDPLDDDIDLDNLEDDDDLEDLEGADDLDDMGLDIEDDEPDDLLDQLDDLDEGGVPAGGPTFADLVEDDDNEEFEGF